MKTFEDIAPVSLFETSLWLSPTIHTVFVFACGYEQRSTSLLRMLEPLIDSGNFTACGFTFPAFPDFGSRPKNDAFLSDLGIGCTCLGANEVDKFIEMIVSIVEKAKILFPHVQLIVDYSSMPRNWYSNLMVKCLSDDWTIDTQWWYTSGKYPSIEYPCVGYGDFKIFSGSPSVDCAGITHVFGLGFDSIRTHGIWNHLDPQRTISFFVSGENESDYRNRIRDSNYEILAASFSVNELCIKSFSGIFSSLYDYARLASAGGDVALVPDGPKPIILAMSVIPILLDRSGVFCWHVGHVKPEGYQPVDVIPAEFAFGFRVVTNK